MPENRSSDFRTSIGGQALIEGILMRGPKKQAIVCRTSDGLVEKVDELRLIKDKYPILGVPFIRGCVTFLDSMVKGMQALTYSADLIPVEEQGEPDKLDKWIESHFSEEKAKKLIIGAAIVLGVLLSLFLFIFLPAFVVGLFKGLAGHYFVRNISEGVVRIIILLCYMKLCTLSPDVKRLFRYHGAEHKTIFCYEHGKELTVDKVRPESRFHPRCGTSFLLVVVVVSILVNSVVRADNTFVRMGCHLLLLPIVVGISYEINLWCGKHDNALSAALSAPGKWLQRITTSEPDDGMIECAIRALQLVIPEESGSDVWGS